MDTFAKRVRAASVAGWWTVLIAAVWMSAGWFFMTWILAAKPQWILTVWGGIITWDDAGGLAVWFFSIFKLILFVMILLTIWLTVWAKKLRKANRQ